MSEIKTNAISKLDGSKSVSTDYVIEGSAKGWANYDGQSSILRDSLNISSVTDNGTGDHSISFIGSFVDIDYVAYGCAGFNGNSIPSSGVGFNRIGTNGNEDPPTPTSVRVNHITLSTGSANSDGKYVMCSFDGDLG